MGISSFFNKRPKLDKDVRKVFESIDSQLKAKQLVGEATSFRNLGKYEEAIKILEKVIKDYKHLPAESILGNTLLMKGDIDGAERYFKERLSEHVKKGDFPLMEIYANLGSLYYNHKKDVNSALKYYGLALEAPRPDNLGIDQKGYEFMAAGVFLDLCVVHFQRQDFQMAKEYALKRLDSVKDCPKASRICGWTLFFDWVKGGCDWSKESYQILNDIIRHLKVAIEETPTDYASLSYSAIALCFLKRMYADESSRNLLEIQRQEQQFAKRLRTDCSKSSDAKRAYRLYRGYALSDDYEPSGRVEFDPTKFLSDISEKAYEKGIVACPKCGKPDIFFALGDRCAECGQVLAQRDEVESLQFALEILKDFIIKYDEIIILDDKRLFLLFVNRLLRTCLIEDTLPRNDDLAKLASFFHETSIGGTQLGFLVRVKKGLLPECQIGKNVVSRLKDQNAFARSVGAIINALNFIVNKAERK